MDVASDLEESARDADWDGVALHLTFSVVAAGVLAAPVSVPTGWRIAGLVVLYVVGLPTVGRWLGHGAWVDLWAFVLPVSVFQVLPDWFLSAVLEVLVFPEDGFPKIGTVSGYMTGLWTIPLFVAISIGRRVEATRGPIPGTLAAATSALAVFWVSEETLWAVPIWHATGVGMIGHAAIYVLVPEAILGAVAYDAYRRCAGAGWPRKILAAATVSLAYTGALAIAYLLIEGP